MFVIQKFSASVTKLREAWWCRVWSKKKKWQW